MLKVRKGEKSGQWSVFSPEYSGVFNAQKQDWSEKRQTAISAISAISAMSAMSAICLDESPLAFEIYLHILWEYEKDDLK